MFRKIISSISDSFKLLGRVFGAASYRFYWDDCFSRASSLAYTSLLALIPLSIIGFWVADSLGYGHEQLRDPVSRLLHQALPSGENELLQNLQLQIVDYIQSISENISERISTLGPATIVVLIVTCIALVNTIESALNVVWRVTSSLGIFSKLVTFWAVVSLGPIVVLATLFWNARVGQYFANNPGYSSSIAIIDFFIPVSFLWFALTFLFYKLPSARVSFTDAVFGAFVSAMLFEVVKRGFAYYVGLSTTYSKLYGVLTTVPLFLFWMYVVWLIVLFGAELSYQAGANKILRGLRKYSTDLGELGSLLGLRILLCVGRRFENGEEAPTESDIAIEVGSDPVLVRTCIEILCREGILTVADQITHSRTLLRSPERITIGDVVEAFKSKKFRSRKDEKIERDTVFLDTFRNAFLDENTAKEPTDLTVRDLVMHYPLHRGENS